LNEFFEWIISGIKSIDWKLVKIISLMLFSVFFMSLMMYASLFNLLFLVGLFLGAMMMLYSFFLIDKYAEADD
jgi:hypothetical protein